MNRFLIATIVAAVCSAVAGAADTTTDTAIRVDVGSTPALNDLAGIVNKNTVLKNNNVAISSSTVAAVSDDTISLEATDGLPTGVTLTGDEEPIDDAGTENVGAEEKGKILGSRLRFCFSTVAGGTTCGWRYPISYWFRIGRFLHADECEFDRTFGEFHYC